MGRQRASRWTGAAQTIALATLGVSLACVSSPPATVPGDADDAIALEVERELAGDDEIESESIRVQVTDGVVVLSGVVRSAREAREALRLTAGVRGVREVVNRLVVIERSEELQPLQQQ